MAQALIRAGFIGSWLALLQACGGGVSLQSVGKPPLVKGGESSASAEDDSSAISPAPSEAPADDTNKTSTSSDAGAKDSKSTEEGTTETMIPEPAATPAPGAAAETPIPSPAAEIPAPSAAAATPAPSPAAEIPPPSVSLPPRAEPPAVASVEDVLASCSAGARSTQTVKVVFDEAKGSCNWGKQGNLSASNGTVRARFEQKVHLNLPQGQLVCEVSISSSNQTIRFDDELLLTFNDIVLLSSLDYTSRLPRNPDSPDLESFLYDWGKLAGGKNPGRSENKPYCLGAGQPGAVCTIPQTQSKGSFALALSPRESALLGFSAKKKNAARVGLIVTGDNDDSSDCKHSKIELDVSISTISLTP